jgi:pyruvate-ferredoxin/flavodoxin oxidoreductase
LSQVFPDADVAIGYIKEEIKINYGKKGDAVVQQNYAAVDASIAGLREVNYPKTASSKLNRHMGTVGKPPKFVKEVLGEILAARGNALPVSALLPTADGTFPTATAQYEKRNIAIELPIWEPDACIL